ncbi:DUF6624 domain-containing protein [Rhodanobacter sp. DHG33]|uniref:DUF6624 domain-containing protein n=1 Tax=Rhodanobacter sp. DHG33 TaxID=2775921 RepID=UPI0017836FDE|nr:DUF6624 domain-containing protein [Rhodanobacter sp. DHG33]MBD8900509.1 hypothetical protein [Rhodanobacter sp. DHG33]
MHKVWLMGTTVLMSGWLMAAHAADDSDAQWAQSCPGMAAWAKVQETRVAAERKVHPPASPSQPMLRKALLQMGDADAKARNAAIAGGSKDPALFKAAYDVDGRNLPRIRQIDAAQGFPTPAQVGSDGMHAAWQLVQHADRDPGFQAHVLEELQGRPGHGGVDAQEYATLTDRVLLAQHKLQRYGTQFDPAGIKDGELKPSPMEDAGRVDQRRAAAGLPPLADYECLLRVVYKVPAKS